MRLGILVALEAEALALGVRGPQTGCVQPFGRDRLLVVSGMGPDNAEQAGMALVRQGAEALLSIGTAGALDPGLAPGKMCLPREVLWQGRRYPCDASLRQDIFLAACGPVSEELLLSVATPCASPMEKRAAFTRCGAAAVDMESGALAALAEQYSCPFAVFRVIVDSAGLALPAAVLKGVDPYGRVRPLPFLWQLLRGPAQVADLWGLRQGMMAASGPLAVLGGFLAGGPGA